MKITQLPKATAVTDSDIAVIVQDGETRQIPCKVLAPPAPDDLKKDGNKVRLSVGGKAVGSGVEIQPPPDGITLDGNTLHLTENGAPVGTGAELPIPAPWAKQIIYNTDTVYGCIAFTARKGTTTGKPYAEVNVILPCVMYTRNETEILSVTPILSDFRGINVIADPLYEFGTKTELNEKCIDISESFHVQIDGEFLDAGTNLFQVLATENDAEFVHVITAGRMSETQFSDGIAYLEYNYRFLFAQTDTETRDALYDEICVNIQNHTTDFTVQYAEIACTKNAEVIQDVN